MRRFLHIAFSASLLMFISTMARGQAVDMNLGSPTITPNPAVFPGTTTIGFTVTAEILDETLSSDDLSASFASVTVTFSGLQGSQSLLPTGDGADLFNWTYNQVSNAYTGTSKDVTMVADQIYKITFSGAPVTGVTTANQVGFLANLTPPGDLFSSVANDDDVRIYTSAVLPVTLVSFTAHEEGQAALLNWATTEETNSDYFEVQHSLTGKSWQPIERIFSFGESRTLRQYTFTHVNPGNGENLYRLKMVDKDGTFSYSRIQSVNFNIAGRDMFVYPNPSSDFIHLRDFESIDQIRIIDMKGNTVFKSNSVKQSGISVRQLPAGAYSVRIWKRGEKEMVHRIVVYR